MSGTIRLGKYLSIDKESLISIKPDKTYTIAGVQNYGKGVLNKRVVKGSELTMKKYQVIKRNQLMWCKVDTKNGAFGITKEEHEGSLASTNMCLANIDTVYLNPDFLQLLFTNQWFYNSITEKSTGTTNRQYLTPPQLFELVEIPDFDIDEQEEFLKRCRSLIHSGLFEELDQQQTYLQLLRQTILQEAVQGKLTKQVSSPKLGEVSQGDGGVDEPATQLLKRIKAEKEKLVKLGKLKKDVSAGKAGKELSPITEDEIPFELPEGWVWCRIEDISTVKVGSTPSRQDGAYWKGEIPWVSSGEVANNYVSETKEKITQKALKETSVNLYPINTVLIAMIGQGKTRGQSAILKIQATTNQNVAGCIIDHGLIVPEYLWDNFLSSYEGNRESARGGNQPALNGQIIKRMLFPLPPLAEQHRIVAKVQQLQQQLSLLEAQVQQSRQYVQQLLQSLLKEAFKPQGKLKEEWVN